MKKMKFYMNVAASVMLAFGMTACNAVVDNAAGTPADNPADQVVAIQSGDTLATVISQLAVTTDNVIVEIPEGVDTVYTGEIKMLGKQLTITGSEGTVVVATAPIIVDNSITIENVTVDASELTNALVLLNEELPADVNDKGAYTIDEIAFNNVTVEGLAYQLFFANKKKYIVNKLAVENSIIAIDGKNKKTVFDFNGGGLPVLLSINKSTIYANPSNAVNGGFYSTQSGSRFVDLGVEENVISITNSTLYNIAKGKPVSTLRQNSQAQQKYIVKNSIIVNCGAKNNQFLKGLNGRQKGKANNWDIDNNVIVYDGEVSLEENTIAGEINNPIPVDPKFKDPENGNFRPTDALFLNLGNKRPGDPRWVGGVRADLL